MRPVTPLTPKVLQDALSRAPKSKKLSSASSSSSSSSSVSSVYSVEEHRYGQHDNRIVKRILYVVGVLFLLAGLYLLYRTHRRVSELNDQRGRILHFEEQLQREKKSYTYAAIIIVMSAILIVVGRMLA